MQEATIVTVEGGAAQSQQMWLYSALPLIAWGVVSVAAATGWLGGAVFLALPAALLTLYRVWVRFPTALSFDRPSGQLIVSRSRGQERFPIESLRGPRVVGLLPSGLKWTWLTFGVRGRFVQYQLAAEPQAATALVSLIEDYRQGLRRQQ